MGWSISDIAGADVNRYVDIASDRFTRDWGIAGDAFLPLHEGKIEQWREMGRIGQRQFIDTITFSSYKWEPLRDLAQRMGWDTSPIDKVKEYALGVGSGLDIIWNKALDGDKDAIQFIVILVITIILTIFGWGQYAGMGYYGMIMDMLSYASLAYSAYSYAEQLKAVDEMQKLYKKLIAMLANLKEQARVDYIDAAMYGNKDMWMAGGDLYNSIYAGGDLFNITGSLNQNRFISMPDSNMDNRFAWLNDRYHDYYKKLGTHTIGTDNFSVMKFGMV